MAAVLDKHSIIDYINKADKDDIDRAVIRTAEAELENIGRFVLISNQNMEISVRPQPQRQSEPAAVMMRTGSVRTFTAPGAVSREAKLEQV
jgi:hypothetical protein